MSEQLSLHQLQAAVTGNAAAIRATTRLIPAGGPSEKVFPPTYAGAQYAYEDRWIEGERVRTVLLDSVPSQANRLEQALLQAYRRRQLHFPLIEVDFSQERDLADLGRITTLDAPHRIADAILRDSLHQGLAFRLSEPGQRFTTCSPKNASALFELCPTACLLGVWDSTGPRGAFGARFERALVSEIIGVDPLPGRRTAGRLDPLLIRSDLGNDHVIYKHKDPIQLWTLDSSEAEQDERGRPRLFKTGKPSAILHGNITPDLARASKEVRAPGGELIARRDAVLEGGVTIHYALQTTVLSLVALRRLAFPGSDEDRPARDAAACTTLAALGLAGVVLQREQGYDLRSRCLLVPQEPLVFELIPADGGKSTCCRLDASHAAKLVAEAVEQAKAQGLRWETRITLTPSPKLVRLVRRTRELEIIRAEEESEES